MKKCSRCGHELLTDQLVCPHCGKPQREPRRVRCRYCGTISSQGLRVCPSCGESLRQDWLRPLLLGGGALLAIVLVLLVGSWLLRWLEGFQPSQAIGAVQAMASEVPVLVEVPTLTPSLTPSLTPTPTPTPTSTPEPSATPIPTLTPTPTWTPTPEPTGTSTPTPTRTRAPVTTTPSPTPTSTVVPTQTPTPVPPIRPPVPIEPEDGAPHGQGSIFRLGWQSSHTLKRDECYLVNLRYTHAGAPVIVQVCVQQTSWWVDESLYGQADQETDRVYFWSVQVARKSTDAEGKEAYVPLSPASEEWRFYWR